MVINASIFSNFAHVFFFRISSHQNRSLTLRLKHTNTEENWFKNFINTTFIVLSALTLCLPPCQSDGLLVCLSDNLLIHLSSGLSDCMTVYLMVCSYVRLSLRPSVRLSLRPSVSPSVCPSVSLSVCPSVSLSILLHAYPSFTFYCYLFVCELICLRLVASSFHNS